MPRNNNPGASTLRNRNRITNKTRLRVLEGSIDADPLVIEEDEEKARVVSTAGVDAEDANEHHLQAVLSEASHRNQANGHRGTRGAEKDAGRSEAYIPVPDSTGVAPHYDDLYPANRWVDPANYMRTSDTVEEAIDGALVDGYTYLMDERDKEWLDKNNEEARGEGTSAQGAFTPGTTRMSQRNAKGKGKDPDVPQPVAMTEDELELVMGIFEKVTHEKWEFLHHSLTNMPFPTFANYQDIFASPLPASIFAAFAVPAWIPAPPQLLRMARVVYDHWRARCEDRGGRRIMPVLNFDEQDLKNESYICFRRREVKTVRKTRAQQASPLEKMLRLRDEMQSPTELATAILRRESEKKAAGQHGLVVWQKRVQYVALKRKYNLPTLKEDDELLIDKERPPKRPKPTETGRIPGIRIKRDVGEAMAAMQEIQIRPKERYAQIAGLVDLTLTKQKERDVLWEDGVDNPYQRGPVSHLQRTFKWYPRPESATASNPRASHVAFRARMGRGGRQHLDRRLPMVPSQPPGEVFFRGSSTDAAEAGAEDPERTWRMRDRWLNDRDDCPAVGPEGPDEQDRILLDDHQPTHLLHSMTLLYDQDHTNLSTDPSLNVVLPDGRHVSVSPFRLGVQQTLARPFITRHAMAPPHVSNIRQSTDSGSGSMQTPQKIPSASLPHLRISSNGGMRPPTVPNIAISPPSNTSTVSTSPHPNGAASPIKSPGVPPVTDPARTDEVSASRAVSPIRPKSTVTVPVAGYHLPPTNGYVLTNGTNYLPPGNGHGLSPQQRQNVLTAFAGTASSPPIAQAMGAPPAGGPMIHDPVQDGANGGIMANGHMNLQLPLARQKQWLANTQRVQVNPDGSGVVVGHSPNMGHAQIAGMHRVPSANGFRGTPVMSHVMAAQAGRASPAMEHMHSSSPVPVAASPGHSPARPPSQASLIMSPSFQQQLISPSMAHQQVTVQGGQGGGF